MHPDPFPLRGISSMATRQLLADLARNHAQADGPALNIESVGGVDAARRVREGEPFDLVFLASDAIAKLVAGGYVLAGSQVDMVRSQVAIAVRAGAARPQIGSELELQQAVLAASSIGYSTGPSGNALLALFERWGILGAMQSKLLQAPAGVPVAALVSRGEVALGFQQRSEMMGASGVDVVGDLPQGVAIETIFSGGVCSGSQRVDEARAVLANFASATQAPVMRRHGMAPM